MRFLTAAAVLSAAVMSSLSGCGGGAARAYNLLQGQEEGRVRWSEDFLMQQARAALLRYLAVAHFGRGRGEWTEGEAPAHWLPRVAAALDARASALQAAWMIAAGPASGAEVAARLEPELAAAARDVLVQLYPDAAGVFEAAPAASLPA